MRATGAFGENQPTLLKNKTVFQRIKGGFVFRKFLFRFTYVNEVFKFAYSD